MRLKNKVAIITGGTSGIGRSSCVIFAREGAKVVVVGQNRERGDAVVDEIRRDGERRFSFPSMFPRKSRFFRWYKKL